MNRYGQLALDHVSHTRPTSLTTIADPTSHFTRLGDLIQDEVTSLQATLVGQRLPHESDDELRRRVDRAVQQAEKIVLHQTLTTPDDLSATPLSDDPEAVTHRVALKELSQSMSRLDAGWTEAPPDQL